MKIQAARDPVVQPPVKVTLELTQREAEVLYCLANCSGGIAYNTGAPIASSRFVFPAPTAREIVSVLSAFYGPLSEFVR